MMTRLAHSHEYASSLTGLAGPQQATSRRSHSVDTHSTDEDLQRHYSAIRARLSSDITMADNGHSSDGHEVWMTPADPDMVQVPPMGIPEATFLSPFGTPETPEWMRRVLKGLDPEHPLSRAAQEALDITPAHQDPYEAFLQKAKVPAMGDDAPYSSPIFSRPGPSGSIRMLTDLPSSSLPSPAHSQTPVRSTYTGPNPYTPRSSESRDSYWTPVKGSQGPTPFIHRPTPRYATSDSFIKRMRFGLSCSPEPAKPDREVDTQDSAPSSSFDIEWDPTPPITDELAALLDGDAMSIDTAPRSRISSEGETLLNDGGSDPVEQRWKPVRSTEGGQELYHAAEGLGQEARPFFHSQQQGIPSQLQPFTDPPAFDLPPASYQPPTQDVYASRLLRFAADMDSNEFDHAYAPKLQRSTDVLDEYDELLRYSPPKGG
ncbi:hypothetical protein CALCODRAFT_555802 [Calocera cornea HHB12733]|uniref:Uncharacterized protein n=1 Tax=Calocera cornea HHB12733 TaxID=1353952 RepID=A0A165FEQ3_9BASI|nr:hypothetical protein CALCODRAFT_555802 [Calocera cornea HHB12733]